MSVIDAHVHVWRPSALPYPWLASMPALDRDLGPADIDDAGGESPRAGSTTGITLAVDGGMDSLRLRPQ